MDWSRVGWMVTGCNFLPQDYLALKDRRVLIDGKLRVPTTFPYF